MCTKRISNRVPITTIHPLDYNLATAVLITTEGQNVIREYLEIEEGWPKKNGLNKSPVTAPPKGPKPQGIPFDQFHEKESHSQWLSKIAFFNAYKGTKEMNKVNPKVIELVEKIKSRGHNPGESSAFLKTVKEQGIQFASGNGMTPEELTTFLQESKDNREHAKECAECDLKEWIKEEIISNNIGQHLCEQCSYKG